MSAWVIEEADAYIELNTLDNEDYFDADETRRTALLNVAERTIRNKLDFDAEEQVPDEAVYQFAPVLAALFNDTNKMAQQGIASFSIRGISFTFKDWAKRDLSQHIPDSVYDICGKPRRRIKTTLL